MIPCLLKSSITKWIAYPNVNPLSKYQTTRNGYEYKKRKHFVPLYRTGGTFEFYVGLIARLAWYYLSFKLYLTWL